MEKLEVWKDIPGYEGLYQVSNLGNVKSFYGKKEIFKKPTILKSGYLGICLKKNGLQKHYRMHQLVAMAFLNHIPDGMNKIIDHIDGEKINNQLTNLRIVNNRENSLNRKKKRNLPQGVLFQESKLKPYFSQIWKNNKSVYLGSYATVEEASQAYQQALKTI